MDHEVTLFRLSGLPWALFWPFFGVAEQKQRTILAIHASGAWHDVVWQVIPSYPFYATSLLTCNCLRCKQRDICVSGLSHLRSMILGRSRSCEIKASIILLDAAFCCKFQNIPHDCACFAKSNSISDPASACCCMTLSHFYKNKQPANNYSNQHR